MNYSERIAQQIIEALLPSATVTFRPRQSDGEHDFDLRYENGQIVPLEVTVSTDEPYVRLEASIRDARKGGPFVPTHHCRQDWYVFPKKDAIQVNADCLTNLCRKSRILSKFCKPIMVNLNNANKIRQNIDSYLAVIEAEGRQEFFVFTDALESPGVKRIYADLGIEAGRVFKWKNPGVIGIGLPSLGSEVDPEFVLCALELEARKPDNRRKLGDVASDEAHLFVYIEHRNFPAWLTINDMKPTSQPPILPPEVTHVWVAASTREVDKFVVWRASAVEGWLHTDIVKISKA